MDLLVEWVMTTHRKGGRHPPRCPADEFLTRTTPLGSLLAVYIAAGRKSDGTGATVRQPARGTGGRSGTARIRLWAIDGGHQVASHSLQNHHFKL
jgi:hypothetical protein